MNYLESESIELTLFLGSTLEMQTLDNFIEKLQKVKNDYSNVYVDLNFSEKCQCCDADSNPMIQLFLR